MRRLPLLVVLAFTLASALAPAAVAAPSQSLEHANGVSHFSFGSGSCGGLNSCTGATGDIGNNSCTTERACMDSHANIGNGSCNGTPPSGASLGACQNSSASIGDGSCNNISACGNTSGTIGNSSCNGNGGCLNTPATIGNNSCNSGAACAGASGPIGHDSCTGASACVGFDFPIGNNACNGNQACSKASGPVADNTCNGDFACVEVIRIVYVTPTGAGLKNGTSWSNAHEGLWNALDVDNTGDEIWVAAGTYLSSDPAEVDDRDETFRLHGGTWVYGGFAGTETTRDQRDWVAHPTVLSGDIGVAGDVSDNVYHVVNDGERATLDGFTITGGNNDLGAGGPSDYGGGLYTDDNNSVFRNLIVTGNASISGGGIGVTGGQPTFSNIVVVNNHADQGGGIALATGLPMRVTNAIVSGNLANLGGGIYALDSSAIITNVTISGNEAVSGAGLYNTSASTTTLTMRNSIVWGNGGSQIVNTGSATANVDHSDVQGGLLAGTTDGGGNLNADPMFVSPIVAPAPTASGDLHLQAGSPAINVGANAAVASGATDIDGDARILSGTVDMGSDEVRTTCQPGYWSSTGDDRTGTCSPAAIGFYVDHSGATSQTPCPAYKTTTTTASDSAADCIAVSPYSLKQAAVSELQDLLPTGSVEADNKLNKAITNITASLASWRWVDADSLSPLHGFRVFNKERHAVTWLWTGVLRANPTWSAVANDAINRLVAADRAIVVQAIAESTDSAAIAKANAKLAQADALLAQQQRSKAIYKLRAAWLAVN